MAFVIPKAEKKSVLDPQGEIIQAPGPGQYNPKSAIEMKNDYCAPFNTSEVKISYFDVPQTKYGPGTYQPKYFKDLNKMPNNKGYVFASKVQRFKARQQDPTKQGPQIKRQRTLNKEHQNNQIARLNNSKSEMLNNTTIYSENNSDKNQAKQLYNKKLQKSKSLMQQIRQHNRQNRVESIKGKRQFIRVILTNSTNTENVQSRYIYRNIKGKTLGPGSYQNIQFKPKSKNIMNWSLDKKDRFQNDQSLAPGPGTYHTEQNEQNDIQNISLTQSISKRKKQKLSAPFASTVIRSHMDTLIYRTNIPIKAAILQDRRLKDTKPGPGTYNCNPTNKNRKSFNYGVQNNFGSTKRQGLQQKQYYPGPGAYNPNLKTKNRNECNQIIKSIRQQIFGHKARISQNYNKNNSLNRSYSQKISGLDPNFNSLNSYREKKQKKIAQFCSLQQRCFSKLGSMPQQQRFKQENKKQEIVPGPGQYYNQNQYLNSGFGGSNKNGTSVFKSDTDRDAFSIFKTNGPNVPYYNIIRNDIGFKAQKTRKYIQNLKRINIDKTPFQTSQRRFKQNDKIPQFIDFSAQQLQSHKRNPSQYVSCDKVVHQSSNFKSGTKREVFKSQQKPGPGDYNIKMKNNGGFSQIQKKSFNKYYGLNKGMYDPNKKISHSGGFKAISKKNSVKNKSQIKVVNAGQQKKQEVAKKKSIIQIDIKQPQLEDKQQYSFSKSP